MKQFRVPREIYFSWGSLDVLKSIEGNKAFVVVDKPLIDLEAMAKIKKYLTEAGLQLEIYSEVVYNPSRESVKKATEAANAFQPDWIVAVGGGSTIDMAKVMWIFYEHPNVSWDDVLSLKIPKLRNKARFIAVSSTSGTGSEVTPFAPITNTDVIPNFKEMVFSYEITPDIAITDPELTVSMPPQVTAATGLDALTHAIECYTSTLSSDVDKALALGAIKMIFEYLPKAFAHGQNQLAREKMHTAQLMAGLAFSSGFLGVAHPLGHQVTSAYNIPHGTACILMLPYVIQYNSLAAGELYAEIADALGIEYECKKDATKKLVERLFELERSLEIPSTIKGAGVDEKDFFEKIEKFVKVVFDDVSLPFNPRLPKYEDIKMLYEAAFYGKEVM